jgi:hypothetical protein
MGIEFQPRWKEMLDGFIEGRRFTLEITMGRLHVFWPREEVWEKSAPIWAKGRWKEAKESAIEWCESQKIPFDEDISAWVEFESQNEKPNK